MPQADLLKHYTLTRTNRHDPKIEDGIGLARGLRREELRGGGARAVPQRGLQRRVHLRSLLHELRALGLLVLQRLRSTQIGNATDAVFWVLLNHAISWLSNSF